MEEVVVGEGEDGRQRLSISGWFHAAQPGEEGYDPDEGKGEFKSSREQLVSPVPVTICIHSRLSGSCMRSEKRKPLGIDTNRVQTLPG